MFIVIVDVSVKTESIEAFKAACRDNSENSLKEPGIARFDVLQDQADPSHFQLIEVYRTADDPAKHKETAHYARWRDTVADMMLRPRTNIKYNNVAPSDLTF